MPLFLTSNIGGIKKENGLKIYNVRSFDNIILKFLDFKHHRLYNQINKLNC